MMKRRLPSLLMAIVMCLSLFCTSAMAADESPTTAVYDAEARTVTLESTDSRLTPNMEYLMIGLTRPNDSVYKTISGTADANGKLTVTFDKVTIKDLSAIADWKVYVVENSGVIVAETPLSLKETLSDDATLSALSYTVSGGSAVGVPGFVSGTTTYNVKLPAGTARDAAITLMGTVTATGKATITANEGVTLSNGVGTATITVTAQDGITTKTYSVNFSIVSDTPNPPVSDKVTVTFDLNGAAGTAPASQKIDRGGKAAKPTDPTREGYSFGGWYKEAACKNEWNFTTDTVSSNMTLYAKWIEVAAEYSITFDANGGTGTMGSVKLSKAVSGDTTYSLPVCTFTAPKGKVFDKWTVTGTGLSISGNTLTIASTVDADADITVTATWKEEQTPVVTEYTITASAGTGGSISPSGSVKVTEGGSQTFTVTANYNYVVSSVTVDGSAVSLTGGRYTFSNVTANHTISVTFRYVGGGGGGGGGSSSGGGGGGSSSSSSGYSISVPSRVTGGSVTVRPTSASRGDKVTITAKPNSGYEVESVTVTDRNGDRITVTTEGNNKYTFIMPGSKVDVKVEFVRSQTTPSTVTFTDVRTGDWFYSAVQYAQQKGLMSGVGNSRFDPNSNLSRAQLAQILYNASGNPAAGANRFTDVPAGQWYTNAVSWAAQSGIVSGYGDGKFGPNDNITREQLAVMLWRYAGQPAPKSTNLNFTDANQVSSYAVQAMRWAVENGIISGYGEGQLAPRGLATRAQVASMLMRYMEK